MIATDRLLIRQFTPDDSNELYEYLSDPLTYTYEPGRPITLAEAKDLCMRRSKGMDFLAVELKFNGKMIGHLYFKQIEPLERMTWELGYIFNPRYQKKGYASEAAAAITHYAFKNLSAHRIMARCNPENTASWKLLEGIGYKREGHFLKYGFVHRDRDGQPIWTDAFEYSKIEE